MKQVRSPTTSSMPNSVNVLTMTWLVAYVSRRPASTASMLPRNSNS
jgi:hypothetical protein